MALLTQTCCCQVSSSSSSSPSSSPSSVSSSSASSASSSSASSSSASSSSSGLIDVPCTGILILDYVWNDWPFYDPPRPTPLPDLSPYCKYIAAMWHHGLATPFTYRFYLCCTSFPPLPDTIYDVIYDTMPPGTAYDPPPPFGTLCPGCTVAGDIAYLIDQASSGEGSNLYYGPNYNNTCCAPAAELPRFLII